MWIDNGQKKRYDVYTHLTRYEERPVIRETGGTKKTIKSVRESLGMTLPELALRAGLPEQRIRQLENHIERPSPEETSKIAVALNLSPDELIENIPEHAKNRRNTDLHALLETIDDNVRRFISDKEVEQLENALRLSIDAVERLKRDR